MSYDHSCQMPQVFLVDQGGGQLHSGQFPSLVPCWSFPSAQGSVRDPRKRPGMGVSGGLALVMLFLFLLVFSALSIGAFYIYNIETELSVLRKVKPVQEFSQTAKQIGLLRRAADTRAAAHVIGRIEHTNFHKTLRWNPHIGQAFTAGGVAYRIEDGALQVNETGLYHIYSRVEMIFRDCSPTPSFVHSVFVRREGHPLALTLMEAHRAGFCSQQLGHAWTSQSYLGAALQLQRHDKVLVNVSHPRYLTHEPYANFFGLYKM
ncbi:tumor necrosis factor ligand superfamily member 6 [Aulostomus maculatus]